LSVRVVWAYCSCGFTVLRYNVSGSKVRVRLPECVVTAIRTRFPNEVGVFYGDEDYF
jgi:hypothetical protein